MRKTAIALTLLAGIGCGGDDDGGGGGGGLNLGGDVPLEDLGDVMAEVVCDKIFGCCDPQQLSEQMQDPEVCEATYGGFVEAFFVSSLIAAENGGRARYHGDIMGDCLALIDDLSCDEYLNGEAADFAEYDCENWIEPLVPEGGECMQSFECTTGACDGASGFLGEGQEFGVCILLPGDGDHCDNDCEEGLYCDGFGDTAMCVAQKANGEECSFDEECRSSNCVQDPAGDFEVPDYCEEATVCEM